MWNEASVAARGDVEGIAEGLVMDDVVHVGRSWFRMTPAVATGDDDAVVVRSMPVSKTARLGEIVVVPPDDMTARSLFESAFETTATGDELLVGKPRRTVTVSLWGLATMGAALLFTGAAVAVMLRSQPVAPIAAPAVTAAAPVVAAPVVTAPVVSAPAPVPPQAAAVVEPLAAEPPAAEAPSPPSEVVAAEVSEPVPAAPAVRPSLVRKAPMPVQTPVRRVRPAAPAKVEAAAAATVPDPFAPPPAKKAWVDPFAD